MNKAVKLRHELKHSISNGEDVLLSSRLRNLFPHDENADAHGVYRVRSLYFDTPQDMALRQKLDGDYVADLMDAHRELQKEIRRLLRSSREAEKKILRLQDGRHRAVLQLRYLCAMDWDEVADKLHYTLRWTHKLHREALEQLTELGICREDA